MARDETIKLSLIDGVTKSLGQIRDGVSGVGASLTKLNQGAELAAKGFGAVASAASAIGGAVQGAADLESALAALQAVTGASAAEFATLREAAISASERTRFTAIEAADGLTELARAGLSATEAINVLNPALSLAQGNNLSVAQSSELLTTTIKQFGASMGEAARFADVLQATADGTATSVEQIGNAMSYVAPLARQAGVSIEQTSAVIGALADQGFRGERAGTALRNVFSALADPASKFSEALSDAGIRSRDFSTVIEALGKKGDAAKKILLALDSEARPAILSLVNGGGSAIADLTRKLEESAGAAERTSAILGDTFNGAVARLQNSVTNLRNEFLSPILQPLADEAVALAEKINALGDSPQFARIRDQFQELATNAIRSVGDLIEKADLEEWAGDVAEFGTEAKLVFDDVAYVAGKTADAIRGVSFAIKFLRGDKDLFSDSVDSLADGTERLGRAGADAGDTIADLGGNLASGERQTRSLVSEVLAAVGRLKEFASSMIEAGRASARASDDIATIFSPSEQAREQLLRLSGGAEQAAIGLERLRLATLTSAIAALARENLQGTDTFRALVAEVAKTEASIAKMQEAIDKAKGAQKDLSDKTDSAANSLRNFASAAGDAGDAADDLKSSNSQVADSFGNIGNQASETAISLGNLSEAFVRQALEAAGAAKSAKDYIDTLNRYFAAGADQEEKIKARLDQLSRQNAALSEEEQIRKRLALQYGTSSTLLDELVRKELELARAKKQANDETERGIQIEAQRTAGFGAVNFGQQAEATGGATGGRGSSGGGGDRGAPQIVINVQGMTTDQARQFVEQSVVPELERINRLSR